MVIRSINAGFAGCREMLDYMHISSNAVNFLFRCVAVRKRSVSFRRGSLLALRLTAETKEANHSMRDLRAQSTHTAFALDSETLHAPSQYDIKWMKWCFWFIPRTLPPRQTVLVLCLFICFCDFILEVIDIFSILSSVYGKSVYFYLCTVQLMFCGDEIAPLVAFCRTKVVRVQSKQFLCQSEYWVKVVHLSLLCLPALIIRRR